LPRAYVILRDSDNLFPNSWDVTPEASGWYSVFPTGRENPNVFLHAKLIAVSANGLTSALFVFTPNSALNQRLADMAAASSNAWTLAELRADNGATATAIKNRWQDKNGSILTLFSSMMGHDYPVIGESGEE
jgi:tRNA U34 5-methylaminomethyl-2-thiouridine-forming methyltransferase MnmC